MWPCVSFPAVTPLHQPDAREEGQDWKARNGSEARVRTLQMNEQYLSGPAGCTWPAVLPDALGAHRPPSARPSAASGAPPPPAAPLGPPGRSQVRAARGRPPPVPPAARTGTRRGSWLRRAKGRGRERLVAGASQALAEAWGNWGREKRAPSKRAGPQARHTGAHTRAHQAPT